MGGGRQSQVGSVYAAYLTMQLIAQGNYSQCVKCNAPDARNMDASMIFAANLVQSSQFW